MAVVIETTLGDITVDLYLEQRPVTCLNFLKLCKMKYYNYNLFHSIRSGFIAQTGDPSGEGSGGQSIFGVLEGPEKRFFSGEKMPKIRHTDAGLISMVCTDDMLVGSQFFFTLAPDLDSLDGVHCVIGEVTEGHDVLRKLNDVICDEGHRPYRDVRITHTVVLEDPFNDPPGLRGPSRSPSPSAERLKGGRIAPDEDIDEMEGKSAEEIQEIIEEKEAKARATILEIVGDLPDADIAPPENVLFVCKLNPVTTDDDLEIIFSRFGKIVSCEVIRDKKTGDSLQYAFIEFSNKKSCEDAYFKMDNVLIDDRRIHVDFSQSVSKMRWLGKGRGVKYFDEDDKNGDKPDKNDYKGHRNRDRDDYNNHHSDRKNNDVKSHDTRDRNRDREQRTNRHSRREKSLDKNSKHYDNSKDRSRRHNRSRSRSRHEKPRDQKRNERHKNSYDHNRNAENAHNSNSYKSKISSTNEKKEKPKENKEKQESDRYKDVQKRSEKSDKHTNGELEKDRKKSKEDKEPQTPSPISKDKKKHSRDVEKQKKEDKSKKPDKKRKRKVSTSSSESSSDSSSTSSSSSDGRKKKKVLKRRKKKYSTSSSSTSSSSTSSTSSSDSSSSSSSSDSDSKKKKKQKIRKRK